MPPPARKKPPRKKRGRTLIEEGWPLILLGLRIGAVMLLYLFLFSAFRTLRAELRAPVASERPARRRAAPVAAGYPEDDLEEGVYPPDEYEAAAAAAYVAEEPAAWQPVDEPPPAASRRVPLGVAIPSAAAVALLVLGGAAIFLGDDPPGEAATAPPASTEEAAFAPPTATPAPGRVTVGLAAQEDAQVRVTVDGTVQFDGTLRAGQRQSWEGGQRIQVWTDSGKTLLLSVNGEDLGPYSPAMGHADWNRIDYGFWPGWAGP